MNDQASRWEASSKREQVVEDENCRMTIGPYVEVTPGHHMPSWLEVEILGFDEPNISARVELIDNVPRLVEFALRSAPGTREVMPKDLRGHDLSHIIARYTWFVVRDDGSSVTGVRHDVREMRELVEQRRTGKRRINAAFLEQVAEVYRANIDHAPTEAVSRTFGVKHRMATDYVKQARDRKLLPPTKQGRARA